MYLGNIYYPLQHNDPENPFNFPLRRKIMICAIVCVQTAWVVMSSSIAAPIANEFVKEFGVSAVQSRLPVAMFLFGLSVGPVILTPLAEDFGRKKILTICLLVVCAYFFVPCSYIFHIPCAFARTIETIAISRFICAIAGSAVMNSLANIPDLWRGDDLAGQFFEFSCPLGAAYINAHMSWRWVFGIWGIVGVGLIIPYIFLVPETRGGVILAARAQRARKAGHKRAWAIHEKLGHRSTKQILQQTVLRPAIMLCTEPIVYCFALYDGLNYGIIYIVIEAVPLIYVQYGLTEPSINLVFLTLQIGFTLAVPLFHFQRKATLWREKVEGRRNVPEHKLLWAFLSASLFPISMFWFAWTGRPPINMYVSLGGLIGFAISGHIIFVAVSDYTVESYGLMASSAVTGQSFARGMLKILTCHPLCGILSLVTVQFYDNVGYRWATTILAILATVMGVFPFLFYKFGPRIRQSSRYAQQLAQLEKEERERLKFIKLQAMPIIVISKHNSAQSSILAVC
ncbi:MFS general substrate transporter [Tricholoma matsutake]|nr:MFS general substrate transporter [Tricholoma matsutake 945]